MLFRSPSTEDAVTDGEDVDGRVDDEGEPLSAEVVSEPSASETEAIGIQTDEGYTAAEYASLLEEIEEESKPARRAKRENKAKPAEETLSDKWRKLLELDEKDGASDYDDSVSGMVRRLLDYEGKIDDSAREKPSKARLAKYEYEEYLPETPDAYMLALIRRAYLGETEPEASEEERKKAAEEAKRASDLSALQAMMEEEEQELAKKQKPIEEDEDDSDYYDIGEGTAESTDNFNSFELKLFNAPKRIKYFYSELKNELLNYRHIKDRLSASGDSFRQGSKLIAKITISGSSLRLHLALSPDDYNERTYGHYDMSDVKAYEEVPMALDIEQSLDLQSAKFLIQEAMAAHFVLYHNTRKATVNYAAMYVLKKK